MRLKIMSEKTYQDIKTKDLYYQKKLARMSVDDMLNYLLMQNNFIVRYMGAKEPLFEVCMAEKTYEFLDSIDDKE